MILAQSFFHRSTITVAQELLGKLLVVQWKDGTMMSGIINEVEAYTGSEDAASHAARGKTWRNKHMFETYGHIYVYLIYGMYRCLNVTCETHDVPGAVLIRSIIPHNWIDIMQHNRHISNAKNLTNGPGKLTQALDIDLSYNGKMIGKDTGLWIEDIWYTMEKTYSGPRIGISKWLEHHWRFWF